MLVLAVVAFEIPLALSLRDRVNAEVRSQASSQAQVVAATAAGQLGSRAELARLVETSAGTVRGRVIVTSPTGRLLADSAGAVRLGKSYRARPEVSQALEGRVVQLSRHSTTLDEDILATAVPITDDGRTVGAVRVTQSMAAVDRALNTTTAELALIGALVLLLGGLAGVLLARQLARPVTALESAALRLADGDLGTRAKVEGSREQRSLARSFNEMSERLGRLIESQREFVADASHQLRTPLTGIRLRVEEALAARDSNDADAELHRALGDVDRLARLVDELLVLGRAGEHDAPPEKLDLRSVSAAAVERWQPVAREARLRLELGQLPEAAWVQCASTDLDRALDSVIENALRYTPGGGVVSVVPRPGGVEVTDSGPGLQHGEEERVFERFRRGSAGRAGPAGTGLGLAIARELMRSWGGDVRLAGLPGGGARASVLVPEVAP